MSPYEMDQLQVCKTTGSMAMEMEMEMVATMVKSSISRNSGGDPILLFTILGIILL